MHASGISVQLLNDVILRKCDERFGARTMEENTRLALSRVKKYNVSQPPLITVPLTRDNVDNLHMSLRVEDTLIYLLILEL